ncbi:MAG: thioredoxin [Cytophagales bacterium]|nr:MAG: thioredoxin [Cytophagales bacterium]
MIIKKITFILIITFNILLFAQKLELLPSKSFEKKLTLTPNAQILDVRTVEEFKNGAIENSLNIDFNNKEEFNEYISYLDKTKPTFVYCFSGGRSAEAAKILSSIGFNQVFDLEGGYRDWISKKKPVGVESTYKGMTNQEFMALIKSEKPVLTIFSAKWCPPCIKLAPIISEIEKENTNLKVVKIDVDLEKDLCGRLGVDKYPAIVLFKDQKEAWSNVGFITKSSILENLKGK